MRKEYRAQELYEVDQNGNCSLSWNLQDYESELKNISTTLWTWAQNSDTHSPLEGFVLYRKMDGNEFWLMHLAVLEKGCGRGREMLRCFLSAFDAAYPSARLGLEVSEKNIAALRIYEALGFKKVGIRKKYYKDQSDAWVFFRGML